jgi:uncharacterized protein YjaZ
MTVPYRMGKPSKYASNVDKEQPGRRVTIYPPAGQENKMLKVVPNYQGMARYIEEARQNPQENLEDLWNRYVLDAYWDGWAAGGFNEERTRRELSHPIVDLDGLERIVSQLSTSRVEKIVSEAYEKIASLLPYHDGDVAICVMAGDPENRWLIEHSHGVMGTCIGANTLLTINPFGQDWQKWVLYILAHERHHSAWGYHYFFVRQRRGGNLLSGLVSEGAADSLSHLLCPGLHPDWVDVLTPEEETRQWKMMQAHLYETDPDGRLHRRFFFGSGASESAEDGAPWNTGYTIGFHIVQGYLKAHPSANIVEWLECDPEEILAGSGYGYF